MRGWSQDGKGLRHPHRVFPAHAGIVPSLPRSLLGGVAFPCPAGGSRADDRVSGASVLLPIWRGFPSHQRADRARLPLPRSRQAVAEGVPAAH
ncbi:hypothetical protein C3489_36505 [Streptomyces sp. Ru71]|nr:hypothetical protein C3489_36505 [Streptomyces sp. Ru71]